MLNTKKIIDGTIGHNSLKPLAGDKDRDGVMNALDCKPYDPNRQGWFHDAAEKVKEVAKEKWEEGKEKVHEKWEERQNKKAADNYHEEITKEEARSVAWEERRKQAKETAIYRERHRGEQQRAAIKKGGGSGFSSFLNSISPPTKGHSSGRKVTSYKKTTRYVKQPNGTYKKVTRTARPTRTSAPRQNAFVSYGTAVNNNVSNMLGSGSGKQPSMSLFGSPSKKKSKGILDMRL